MVDHPERRPFPPDDAPSEGPSTAETIDAIRWDYDPEGTQLSPLVSSERYFRDFPWESE